MINRLFKKGLKRWCIPVWIQGAAATAPLSDMHLSVIDYIILKPFNEILRYLDWIKDTLYRQGSDICGQHGHILE